MTELNGIEVIVNEEVLSSSPACIHGPTLMFERSTKLGRRRFYACSACRDRKNCSFFQWVDEKNSTGSKKSQNHRLLGINNNEKSQETEQKKWAQLRETLKTKCVNYCRTCSKLLIGDNELSQHTKHEIHSITPKSELQFPTHLLKPAENNKKEAQFYFSQQTTNFLISLLNRLEVTHVLCVGCPRIYENLYQKKSITTLLLDIDERLRQFYSSKQFLLYNMFNHHFFNDLASISVYNNFLTSTSAGKLAIMIDPPFGGMIEPLAFTLSRITNDLKTLEKVETINSADNEPYIFWMFPYFMEKKILESCPQFQMCDYQVNYDNHRSFKKQSKEAQKVSPIRIFTNVNLEKVILPVSEGYRNCEICRRFVSQMNRHCPICNSCTSKNGRRYKHCDICKMCTKSSHTHCADCGVCCPPDHKCGEQVEFKVGCHKCGDLGHKKRQCRIKDTKIFKRGNIKK